MSTAKSCESVRITSPAELFVKVAGGGIGGIGGS